ncbi:hypothetical protein BDV23DRAFT_77724 [Aspergillus alliaceus]|uniref:RanBD1 domain-containing protein n=1 Tax=Petromyces alliaceus TaxID=209559 RepID=A0A5N7CB84_PETAA|nr:hypothetical protein BDV23DRAFT_77724 [Aspergillus alliaceus]
MATDSRNDVGVKDNSRVDPIDTRVTADDSQASDNESGERPVRNKLKETSITSAPNPSTTGASAEHEQNGETSRSSSRGRKRSFDEDQPETLGEDNGHRRKRSRDSKVDEDEDVSSLKAPEVQPAQTHTTADPTGNILSPKKKRSRDQLDKDEPKVDTVDNSDSKTSVENDTSTEASAGEPEKKRHRDASQERAPLKSAFANASSVSPFGSLGASKPKDESSKPAAVTSSSAFASSSLAAFAGSEKSPFGAIGSSATSVFKSPATTEATKPATTGFASAAGTSGFASLGSGFSGFSGGFGSVGSKGGLTSFAAPGGPSVIGSSSKDKPFGAEEEVVEEEKDKVADTAPGEFEQEKTDERFFERPIETGEEEEKTYFSSKAKLFQFSNGEWKERGIGTFKVNVKITDGEEDKKATRLIMRADGVLRVMLNTPIFTGMTVGDASGNEPKSKQIHLASLEEGRSVPTLLRMPSEDLAKELYRVVRELLEYQ